MRSILRPMRNTSVALVALCLMGAGFAQEKPPTTTEAARPQRTEAEARARAEANRRERAAQRKKTGTPIELIADYVKANVGPVPEAILANTDYKIDPVFYQKYADAMGIPVLAS